MKKTTYLIFGLLLIVTSITSFALEIGALGGVNFLSYKLTEGSDLPSGTKISGSSGQGITGGLYFSQSITPLLSLELETLYSQEQTKYTVEYKTISTKSTQKTTHLQVPLLIRVWPTLSLFNIGIGGYWSSGIGNAKTDKDDGTSLDQTYTDAGLNRIDYGAIASIQFAPKIAPKIRLVLDGRYLYGTKQQSNDLASMSLKTREIQAVGGIGIDL